MQQNQQQQQSLQRHKDGLRVAKQVKNVVIKIKVTLKK
jgi:hypothetical protein